MNTKKGFSLVFLLIFSVVLTPACLSVLVDARKGHGRSRGHDKHLKQKGGGKKGKNAPDPHHLSTYAPAPAPVGDSCAPHSRNFDVLSFGAKGDGVSDDSKVNTDGKEMLQRTAVSQTAASRAPAFQAAWKAACEVSWATIEFPSEFRFLIKPITLEGPCMPHLVLQVDGIVMAPPNPSAWSKSNLFQWINFKWVHDFSIRGSGSFDGQGFAWWDLSQQHYKKKHRYISGTKPTALRFYGSNNVTVEDVSIINSPQCHLKFDDSGGIKVKNITITSPETSPNTDGIHLQNTRDVEIHHSTIGCGDDCVSIQTGCSNVHVHHINCGPGHGISLGGLGKDNSVACVSNVTVENINIRKALSGVRIKTWQGGVGSVHGVTFSNIQVSDVEIPIMIDQYYCDKKHCKNQSRAVEISSVKYDRIIGTYSVQPIHLACSDASPCRNVDMADIQLSPSPTSRGFQQALCWNSYGESEAPLVPSTINCLQRSGELIKTMKRFHPANSC